MDTNDHDILAENDPNRNFLNSNLHTLNESSKYFSIDDLNKMMDKNKLKDKSESHLHINIRSLDRNGDSLIQLLGNLNIDFT